MMKFVKQYMETIAGIEIYPLISLCIFFLFFVALIVYVVRMNKNQVSFMESMPLDNDNEFAENNN
ncbi:MAG: CcoQ/FixQ family Cbb3-type cytochrome c oxidase assembly chaperone [Vicingaceae bacterium]